LTNVSQDCKLLSTKYSNRLFQKRFNILADYDAEIVKPLLLSIVAFQNVCLKQNFWMQMKGMMDSF